MGLTLPNVSPYRFSRQRRTVLASGVSMRPLAAVLLLLTVPALAQSPVYGIVDVVPEPVGGADALASRVAYPPEAARAGLRGAALVHATVGADGRVTDAACDAAPSRALCDAAAQAVRASPFRPGQIGGRDVASRVTLSLDLRPPEASGAGASGAGASGAEREPVARLARGSALRVEYPEMARRAGVEGQQIVQFRIDPSGAPVGAVCTRSTNDMLCDAALAAVRRARFIPGAQRATTLPIDFRLR